MLIDPSPTRAIRLVDFFRFYARDFQYNTGVASIRAGLLKKDSKGWASEVRRPIFTTCERALNLTLTLTV